MLSAGSCWRGLASCATVASDQTCLLRLKLRASSLRWAGIVVRDHGAFGCPIADNGELPLGVRKQTLSA